eukprot:GHVU01110219.1.p1 GENE.GHVU01110219.1~~GHVU01110219.1.p1  ORF type:complete len:119 (-),score=3.41 GHVU01110219.1:812-1168(-)
MLAPFDTDLSLAEHLIFASTLAHIVGFLYDLKVAFMPYELYPDIQAWVKAVFVFAAKGKMIPRRRRTPVGGRFCYVPSRGCGGSPSSSAGPAHTSGIDDPSHESRYNCILQCYPSMDK